MKTKTILSMSLAASALTLSSAPPVSYHDYLTLPETSPGEYPALVDFDALSFQAYQRFHDYANVVFKVPARFQGTLYSECKKAGIPPITVIAIIEHESGWNEKCVPKKKNANGSVDRGLMAINSKYQRAHLSRFWVGEDHAFDPFNGEDSLKLGIRILGGLLVTFDGDLVKAIKAYNVGEKGLETSPLLATKYFHLVSKIITRHQNALDLSYSVGN